MPQKDFTAIKVYQRKYRDEHRKELREYRRQYYWDHRAEIRARANENSRQYYWNHRAERLAYGRQHNKNRRAEGREQYLSYRKAHIEKMRAQARETSKRMRAKYPEKIKARLAVNNALQSGKLIKPEACQKCGGKYLLESHHYLGYEPEHWLHVQWLCRRPCHKEEDEKMSVSARAGRR